MAEDGLEDDISVRQWMFTDEEINNSPSVEHGISAEEERTRRAKGVNFIIQAGVLLRLPQTTLAVASIFFHRFYMRCSMVTEKGGLHHYNIAATALFVAAKTEETTRKTKEIVIAVARVAQKNANLIIDEQSKEFWRWKDSILTYEETMLELLTFDVVIGDSQYLRLHEFLTELGWLQEHNKRLRDVAWGFLNDSCMTTICLRLPQRNITVAAIYFAARFIQDRIPDDADDKPWWERIGGSIQAIEEAVNIMSQFYADNPLKKPDNPFEESPGSTLEDLEKSRLRNGDKTPGSQVRTEGSDGGADTVANGNGAEEKINGFENDKARSETAFNDSKGEEVSESASARGDASTNVLGDSDAALKEAANDPATHEGSESNGIAVANGIKRGSDEVNGQQDDPETKRAKVETEPKQAPPIVVDKEDASEEGEVEE